MPEVRARSLRGKLLLWLLPPLVALLALDNWLSYRSTVRFAGSAYDRSLLGAARAMAEGVGYRDGVLIADIPYSAFEMFETHVQERVFYSVRNEQGDLITGYDGLPGPPRPPAKAETPVFYDAQFHGEPIRVVALPKRLYDPQRSDVAIVQVAETTDARQELARSVLNSALLRSVAIVAASISLVWFGIGRALSPLVALREAVRRRRAHDLTPIDDTTVLREVRPLVAAINHHTGRVAAVLAAQERFIADAAHQLRTPLAVLKTQAEFLLRSRDDARRDEAARALLSSTDHAAHLVTQLLTLARGADDTPRESFGPVELNALASEMLLELSRIALDRNMDLGLEAASQPAVVEGNANQLRDLLANLVDNSLRYTPGGGTVTVRIAQADGEICLEVLDNGPGIAAQHRERVFERFYRVPENTLPGSGLGLAIVQQICRAHRATISLGSGLGGKGLGVQVSFPAPPRPAA
ncbi:MAG: sensor histidine kinase N-terminal domain-containing protein [Rhodocyclaceae bacterium]|nr:sensor histidine kinase N-terminal domain-containing protein [Rhodocyclaceae bacterium]